MRKTIVFVIVSILLASICPGQGQGELGWETEAILDKPESVLYNKELNVLYVACINGEPDAEDGNGYIALIGLDGKVITHKWATGLNAPKGMALVEDRLYVTDITDVVKIEAEEGTVLARYPIPGAGFLNDMVADKDNNFYISDTDKNTIFFLEDGESSVFLKGGNISRPNGLYYDNDILYAGNSGSGELLAVDIPSRQASVYLETGTAIDGLKMFGKKRFIISDWQGKVYYAGRDGINQTLLDTAGKGINAADLEYIPSKLMILVPTFNHNTVAAYMLPGK